MPWPARVLAVLGVVGLSAVACGRDVALLVPCTSDADCARIPGEVCEQGACAPPPPGCTSDADCNGCPCVLGTCDCRAQTCTNDGDCGPDEVCETSLGVCGPAQCDDACGCGGCGPGGTGGAGGAGTGGHGGAGTGGHGGAGGG